MNLKNLRVETLKSFSNYFTDKILKDKDMQRNEDFYMRKFDENGIYVEICFYKFEHKNYKYVLEAIFLSGINVINLVREVYNTADLEEIKKKVENEFELAINCVKKDDNWGTKGLSMAKELKKTTHHKKFLKTFNF